MLSKKVSIFKPGGARPKSAHQSVRGRISGPIPMSNPTDDDEFPIRKPGTAYADEHPEEEFPIRRSGHTRVASTTPLETQPVDKETTVAKKEEEPQPAEPETPDSDEASIHQAEAQPAQAPAAVPETPSRPAPAAPIAGPSRASPSGSKGSGGAKPQAGSGTGGSGGSPVQQRTNPSSTLRYSQVSAASTGGSSKPQRKKSTIRGALSRLFGRKKKTGSQASNDTARTSRVVVAADQHRSDPTALNRAKEFEPKRSASLPINEFDRALRSHSVGPDDITAIESARNSLQVEASPNRRRAVTTSSRLRIYSRKFDDEFAGLSPRPASAHGKGGLGIAEVDDDPAAIGRAVTSDSNGEFTGRRRSRSLSGLQDLVAPQSRRRSDEIRYWRESYDPVVLSPLSSGHDVDNEYGDNDETGAPSISISESPHPNQPPKTPPQPFNFGSLATMNEMAGMRITQAASLDMRIGAMESRLLKLERSVNQLCHAVPGFKGPLVDVATPDQTPRSYPDQSFAYTSAAPPMIPAIYQTISAERGPSSSHYSSHSADTDAHSHMSFGEGQTYIGSLHPPSSSATQAPALTVTAADRPTSTSTVRGATSLPTLNAHGASSQDDLVSQLEAERAARQALEAQVKKLSDRLNGLSTTMFAMVGGGPAKSRSQERLTPASSPAPAAMTIAVPPVPRATSVFEDDSDVEDAPGLGDETPSEAFQTPREERYPQYRTFGADEEDDEEEGKRKKASRTLSLSQLTMGKAQPAQI